MSNLPVMCTRRTRSLQTLLRIVLAVAMGMWVDSSNRANRVSAHTADEQGSQVQAGVCEREAAELLGQKTVSIGGSIRPPKKLRSVAPKYPELPSGTTGSGMWIGEVLVNNAGKVAHVWPIREVTLKPPFPAFNNAIVDAIRGWEYEPVLVDGKPSPFCMTVSTNIHFA